MSPSSGLAALNAGVKLPSDAITLVYRSDSSGTTAGFTYYLAEVDPERGAAEAWFVDDIQAAMRHWYEHSGVGPFYYGTRNTLDIVHRGRPQKLDFSGAIAQAGPIQIELLTQYDAAPSAFKRAMMPASSESTRLILMPVALVKSL